MLIVCPNCATSYSIQAPSLGATGRTVRCARCQTQWFATPGREAALNNFVDDVIAEAQSRPDVVRPAPRPVLKPAPRPMPAAAAAAPMSAAQAAAAVAPPPPVRMPTAIPPAAISAAPAPVTDEVAQFTAALDEVAAVPPMTTDDLAPPPAAEIEVSPPIAPVDTSEDIENFAARRAARHAKQRKRKGLSLLPMTVFMLGLIAGAVLIWRNDLVRHAPQTASLFQAIGLPVNIRGVVFEDVAVTKETQDGVTVLVIEGKLVSNSKKPADIPRLRFAVRNATGNEIYSWTAQPPRSILGPGEQVPFRSRLASPPAEANDILVRFFTPRDLASGGR